MSQGVCVLGGKSPGGKYLGGYMSLGEVSGGYKSGMGEGEVSVLPLPWL